MIYRLCHKEGHKSFQCKAMIGNKQRQKLKQKSTSKISNAYIKKMDKKVATPYLIKKKKKWKGDSNQGQQASQQRKGGQTHLGAKRNNFNHEKHQEGLETWQSWDVYHGIHRIRLSLLPSGLVNILDPNFPPMTKVTRFIVFLVFRYAYLFILHLVYLSCLVLQLVFTFV
jgi:hypothetical protein